MEKIPIHVAVIPDGNRRWAKKRGLVGSEGHRTAGNYESLKELFEEAKRLGVKYLSLWGFSTENWKRNAIEKKVLFDIIEKLVDNALNDSGKNGICFKHIGRKDRLPSELLGKIEALEEATEEFSEFYVLLCLDYGGRDEIVRAVNKAVRGGKEVGEESFFSYLDTTGIPDPDLIIRTGGDRRISGFMPYQSVYSEFYFSDLFFPDFKPDNLREAIEDYTKRQRRFGGD